MLSPENLKKQIEQFWPIKGPSAKEVSKYIKKYQNEKIVIKCGGKVLLDPMLLDSMIEDIAILKKLGLTPMLIHGGGLGIKKKLDELNIESKFITGLRVTDEKMIKIVEDVMVEFNKKIIKALEKKSCKAKSITIKENNVIDVEQESKELGFVGKPTKVNTNLLNDIIQKDFIPIVTPMGLDPKGQVFNINADTAAGAIARSLRSRRLLLVTDVEGVLDKNEKLIPEIRSHEAEKLINDQTIHGGMIPKIKTCIDAANNGVRGVVIIDGRRPHSILFELFSDQGAGTLIRR
jgi:acetylglutamate kinase